MPSDLVAQNPNLINAADEDGSTASMWAAHGGHLACLQWLGDRGADLNAANKDGNTASMLAAMGGHLACLQWLGDHGADFTVANTDGDTANMMAFWGGILASHWLKNLDHDTASTMAAIKGHLDCGAYLNLTVDA